MDSFPEPIGRQRFELELKRSRFITTVANVEGRSAAKQFIQLMRDEFPDANHHCWAMVAGHPEDVYQQDQSDDGEPRGTAGKPMLNVLSHSGVGNVAVVVTRYFGGVKLGAGGLVRAYSDSVSNAFRELKTQLRYIKNPLKINCPYALVATLEHRLKATDISISDKEYTDSVCLTLQVPASQSEFCQELLMQLGSGTIIVIK